MVEGSWFESGHVKISFFKGRGRHLHFFLLLPNDTGAPCLGGIHIEPSLKLTKVQCTETWVSPRLRPYQPTRAAGGESDSDTERRRPVGQETLNEGCFKLHVTVPVNRDTCWKNIMIIEPLRYCYCRTSVLSRPGPAHRDRVRGRRRRQQPLGFAVVQAASCPPI